MHFRTRYSPRYESSFDQQGQTSRTKISEMDACDINKIMERFNRTGQIPAMQKLPPNYGDATAMDFATAQNFIIEAREAFLKLPALTRKHFHNDPHTYMEAIAKATPESIPELKKLGILVERQPTATEVLTKVNKTLEKMSEDNIKQKNQASEKA